MKVSIITVCFNSSETILNNIKSVNSQTYQNIQHIFIDGGSEDNTLEIIKSKSKRKNILISESDNGIYDAMNKGLKIASGDIIGILNSDDIYTSDFVITKVVKTFIEKKSDILYGNINYFNEKGKIVRTWKSSEFTKGDFVKGWHPPHPSLFVRRHVYKRHGFFDIDLKVASDFEFMLRIFEKTNYNIMYMNQTLVSMLIGGKSNTIMGIFEGHKEIKKAFKKNNIQPKSFYFVKRYISKIFEYIK